MKVHIETLRQAEGMPSMVEISIGDDRRAVHCFTTVRDGKLERITIFGIAVRFSTGKKVWPGTVVYWIESGNVNNLRANIDKRGTVSLVGFSADFSGKECRSRHNAVMPRK